MMLIIRIIYNKYYTSSSSTGTTKRVLELTRSSVTPKVTTKVCLVAVAKVFRADAVDIFSIGRLSDIDLAEVDEFL